MTHGGVVLYDRPRQRQHVFHVESLHAKLSPQELSDLLRQPKYGGTDKPRHSSRRTELPGAAAPLCTHLVILLRVAPC